MKVKIEWTEEVSYATEIEVDEAEVRQWLTMDFNGVYHPELDTPSVPVTSEQVLEFLRNGDEETWFDQCDTTTDFISVDDRSLENLTLIPSA